MNAWIDIKNPIPTYVAHIIIRKKKKKHKKCQTDFMLSKKSRFPHDLQMLVVSYWNGNKTEYQGGFEEKAQNSVKGWKRAGEYPRKLQAAFRKRNFVGEERHKEEKWMEELLAKERQ